MTIDQDNGNSGVNHPRNLDTNGDGNPDAFDVNGDGNNDLGSDTCGPRQLHNNGLLGNFYFIVGGGGATSHEKFSVPSPDVGTRVV